MKYTFVTSFRKESYDVYAKSMLESVLEKWKPTDFKLYVYLEGYNGNLLSATQIKTDALQKHHTTTGLMLFVSVTKYMHTLT